MSAPRNNYVMRSACSVRKLPGFGNFGPKLFSPRSSSSTMASFTKMLKHAPQVLASIASFAMILLTANQFVKMNPLNERQLVILQSHESRFDSLDNRINSLDNIMASMDNRMSSIDNILLSLEKQNELILKTVSWICFVYWLPLSHTLKFLRSASCKHDTTWSRLLTPLILSCLRRPSSSFPHVSPCLPSHPFPFKVWWMMHCAHCVVGALHHWS